MIFRAAEIEEADECYKILDSGREYQKSQGFEQWLPEYPSPETVPQDIRDGTAFVFADEKGLIGYCAVVFSGEPAYPCIEGAWLSEEPYAVVHRIALGNGRRGEGLSHEAFELIKKYCASKGASSVRIDTMNENSVMRHVVTREGFSYCGTVYYNGSPRLAYEYIL